MDAYAGQLIFLSHLCKILDNKLLTFNNAVCRGMSFVHCTSPKRYIDSTKLMFLNRITLQEFEKAC